MAMQRIVFSVPDFESMIHVSGEMVDDLIKAGTIAPEKIKPLVGELKQAEGFLSFRQLGHIIKKLLKDDNDAIYRVLRNITPGRLDSLLERLDEWRKQEENIKRLPDEKFDKIKSGLRALVGYYPALERYRKAERLEDITGKSLEELELICDLRPIFDENREKIEGMIPYTRLKLVVEGEGGSSEAIEAELSAKQVADLVKKAQMAQAKLKCLRNNLNKWIPEGIPDVERVREPQDKENGDG